jgi:hypothetical protein
MEQHNMDTLSANPLAKNFRQPILYIKLPSQGHWWGNDTLSIPVTGEIPIYSMTAKDEITMRTPDALMNGSSTVAVIESCCPSIKDAWKMPLIDLDAILIAIRIATYGKQMDFTSVCPHCENKNDQAVDVSVMLGNIRPADWSKVVHYQDLEISLKPQSYEDYNKNNLASFEEARILQVVSDETLPDEEKTIKFNDMFKRLIDTGVSQVSKSIASIKTSDGTIVTDPAFITEFLNNCDKSAWDLIKARLNEITLSTNYNQLTLTCENAECKKEFITPFLFEQTNFFG